MSQRLTTHQLARHMLAGADVPVVVGRDIDIHSASFTTHKVSKDGERITFKGEKAYAESNNIIDCFWISGPLI